jgi:hypothetical protein
MGVCICSLYYLLDVLTADVKQENSGVSGGFFLSLDKAANKPQAGTH